MLSKQNERMKIRATTIRMCNWPIPIATRVNLSGSNDGTLLTEVFHRTLQRMVHHCRNASHTLIPFSPINFVALKYSVSMYLPCAEFSEHEKSTRV